jgi:hypothetical protein
MKQLLMVLGIWLCAAAILVPLLCGGKATP